MADLVAGNFRLRFNNNRNEYTSDGGLTWAALGGGSGGGIAFVTTAQARAKSLSGGVLDAALSTYGEYFDDFTGGTSYTSSTAQVVKSLSSSLKGGVMQTTATAGSGIVTVTGAPSFISNPQTEPIYGAWRVRFDGPWTGNAAGKCGITSAALNRYVHFGVLGVGSTSFFSVEVYDGTTDLITATTTPIETTLFHLVEFYSNGTTGTFYFDGVAVNVTVSMANCGTSGMTASFASYDPAATSRVTSYDKAYLSFLAQ